MVQPVLENSIFPDLRRDMALASYQFVSQAFCLGITMAVVSRLDYHALLVVTERLMYPLPSQGGKVVGYPVPGTFAQLPDTGFLAMVG